MSAGAKKALVILGLVLASSVVSWALSALEAHIAPIPSLADGPVAMNAAIDALTASMMRWQLIYLPLLGLAVTLGTAVLLDGRTAWLEAIAASVFLLAHFVMIRSTTVSWASAAVWAGLYCVVAGFVAQLARRWKTRRASRPPH